MFDIDQVIRDIKTIVERKLVTIDELTRDLDMTLTTWYKLPARNSLAKKTKRKLLAYIENNKKYLEEE